MHFKLYKILSNVAELLILYAAKRINKEQLHQYIINDIDMFIQLNSAMFDIHNPCPVGDKTDIIEE